MYLYGPTAEQNLTEALVVARGLGYANPDVVLDRTRRRGLLHIILEALDEGGLTLMVQTKRHLPPPADETIATLARLGVHVISPPEPRFRRGPQPPAKKRKKR